MTGFTRSTGLIGHKWQKKYTQCATSALRFQTASNNLIGLLTIGAVIGTGVTITDYVIEWHLGSTTGQTVLLTGVGSDTAIQAFHPFVSEPVIGGTLYAVIRYIVIDAVRYSPYLRLGQYSPDLMTCLGTITVQVINCSNGGWPDPYIYSHNITYTNNLQPSADAERSIRFDLNPDGSSHFFAWEFTGYNVADRVTIKYYHINDMDNPWVLSDWIIGYNVAATNYTSSPKIYKGSYVRMLLELDSMGFITGDYIHIQITPRVQEPTVADTNWKLSMKCKTSFPCYTGPVGARTLDPTSVIFIWNPTSCRWDIKWKHLAYYEPQADFSRYFMMTYVGRGNGSAEMNPVTKEATMHLAKNITMASLNGPYNTTCVNLAGSLNVIKTGTNVLFTFSATADYNLYKNTYNTCVNQSSWTDYNSDPLMAEHYKWWYMAIRIANSCGDTYTTKYLKAYRSSVFTWNDTDKTLNIAIENTTNPFTLVSCDNTYNTLNGDISQVDICINLADFNITTFCCETIPFRSNNYRLYTSNILDTGESSYAYGTYNRALLHGCIPSDWAVHNSYFTYEFFVARCLILDAADPANNFRLWFYLNDDGSRKTTPEIVYEKISGVQTIPAP